MLFLSFYTPCKHQKLLPRKHKDVVTTLSQRREIGGCISIVSSLETKISLATVNNVTATLKSDVLAKLWQRSPNAGTTL